MEVLDVAIIGYFALRRTITIAVLLVACCAAGFANSRSETLSPDKIEIKTQDLTPLTLLLVDKKTLTAKLQTFPEGIAERVNLGKFKIAIGKETGDKQVEGDNKTPEGIYLTRKSIDGKTLPKKYGSLAIPIDFPNAIDVLDGKTGHGIWLHGVEKASRVDEANVTEGCVAFYNEDIAALNSWLRPERAVVVIADDISAVEDEDERESVLEATQGWLKAWQERDIDSYVSHYHNQFSHRKGKLKKYKLYKKAVFASYKKMTVDMQQIRVINHPKYSISLMNQSFNGDDRYVSTGRKVLYWKKDDDGKWKIVSERFSTRPFTQEPFTKEEYTQLLASRRPANQASKNEKVVKESLQ